MAKHKVVTSDADIEDALERTKLRENEPLAKTVEHIPGLNLLVVGLSNHRRLVLPLEDQPHISSCESTNCSDVEPESAFRLSISIYTCRP